MHCESASADAGLAKAGGSTCQCPSHRSKSAQALKEPDALTDVTILHNPLCSQSRATLALLAEHGIQVHVREYLLSPLSPGELDALLALLGIGPRELMRTGEPLYRELGLDAGTQGHAELVAALHKHPRLIQRPIVMANGRAAIGRPPEAVLDLF